MNERRRKTHDDLRLQNISGHKKAHKTQNIFSGFLLILCLLCLFAAKEMKIRKPFRHGVEEEIDHRRRVESQQLAQHQAADECDSQRSPQLRSRSRSERER